MGLILSLNNSIQSFNRAGFVGLLDQYTGAAAGYSLRRLSVNTTNVVRVRRSSDNAEADFTADEITDGTLLSFVNQSVEKVLNGDFSNGSTNWIVSNGSVTGGEYVSGTISAYQSGIKQVPFTYTGTGTLTFDLTLNSGSLRVDDGGSLKLFTSSGSQSITLTNPNKLEFNAYNLGFDGIIDNISFIPTNVDGYVTTWYDQSGNSNDATQATAANQPKIVNAGSLITSNGYQVIQYDGTDDNFTTSLTATGTMLMGGSDGSAFYEVAISGSYNLLANASETDHPLRESIRVIWGSSLTTAQKTAIEGLVTYTDWDFSDVTIFNSYWRNRSELTDFPLIDTSSGTNFASAWRLCTSLTSFPLLDVSNGTNFSLAWDNCTSLTSFPALDLSSGTNFVATWRTCTSLQDFPANMFDSVTATSFVLAFTSTNLTSQSIENIVVSIDTAGQSNGTLNITGGGNATTATAQTAIDNLRGRGWTVTVPDGY
jgi:hypothetical protein